MHLKYLNGSPWPSIILYQDKYIEGVSTSMEKLNIYLVMGFWYKIHIYLDTIPVNEIGHTCTTYKKTLEPRVKNPIISLLSHVKPFLTPEMMYLI